MEQLTRGNTKSQRHHWPGVLQPCPTILAACPRRQFVSSKESSELPICWVERPDEMSPIRLYNNPYLMDRCALTVPLIFPTLFLYHICIASLTCSTRLTETSAIPSRCPSQYTSRAAKAYMYVRLCAVLRAISGRLPSECLLLDLGVGEHARFQPTHCLFAEMMPFSCSDAIQERLSGLQISCGFQIRYYAPSCLLTCKTRIHLNPHRRP